MGHLERMFALPMTQVDQILRSISPFFSPVILFWMGLSEDGVVGREVIVLVMTPQSHHETLWTGEVKFNPFGGMWFEPALPPNSWLVGGNGQFLQLS